MNPKVMQIIALMSLVASTVAFAFSNFATNIKVDKDKHEVMKYVDNRYEILDKKLDYIIQRFDQVHPKK